MQAALAERLPRNISWKDIGFAELQVKPVDTVTTIKPPGQMHDPHQPTTFITRPYSAAKRPLLFAEWHPPELPINIKVGETSYHFDGARVTGLSVPSEQSQEPPAEVRGGYAVDPSPSSDLIVVETHQPPESHDFFLLDLPQTSIASGVTAVDKGLQRYVALTSTISTERREPEQSKGKEQKRNELPFLDDLIARQQFRVQIATERANTASGNPETHKRYTLTTLDDLIDQADAHMRQKTDEITKKSSVHEKKSTQVIRNNAINDLASIQQRVEGNFLTAVSHADAITHVLTRLRMPVPTKGIELVRGREASVMLDVDPETLYNQFIEQLTPLHSEITGKPYGDFDNAILTIESWRNRHLEAGDNRYATFFKAAQKVMEVRWDARRTMQRDDADKDREEIKFSFGKPASPAEVKIQPSSLLIDHMKGNGVLREDVRKGFQEHADPTATALTIARTVTGEPLPEEGEVFRRASAALRDPVQQALANVLKQNRLTSEDPSFHVDTSYERTVLRLARRLGLKIPEPSGSPTNHQRPSILQTADHTEGRGVLPDDLLIQLTAATNPVVLYTLLEKSTEDDTHNQKIQLNASVVTDAKQQAIAYLLGQHNETVTDPLHNVDATTYPKIVEDLAKEYGIAI